MTFTDLRRIVVVPFVPVLPLAVLIALAVSCGGDDVAVNPALDGGNDVTDGADVPDGPPVTPCAPPGTDFVARFDLTNDPPAVLDVPWPSDVYRDASGKLSSTYKGLDKIVPKLGDGLGEQLALAGSFGALGGAVFATVGDKPVDPKTLPVTENLCGKPGSGAFLVDLDAKDAKSALLPCVASYYDERARTVPTSPGIVVRPAMGTVVPSGHKVAVIVTTAVKSADGKPLQASASFAAVRDPPAGGAALTRAAQLYNGAIGKASALGIDRCAIAALTTYATFDTDGDMAAAHVTITAAPVPKLSWNPADILPMGPGLFSPKGTESGYSASLDAYLGVPKKAPTTFYDPVIDDPGDDQSAIAHDAIGAMGTAVFDAPNLMVPDPTAASHKHNNWYRDGGKPAVNPAKKTNKIWATFVLPKTAPPANGYPVVILQHGLNGERRNLLAVANIWAREGWASVGINAVGHGPRGYESDTALHVDKVAHVKDSWPVTETGKSSFGTYDGPDGFADDDGGGSAFLGDFLHFVTARDQVRQSALDLSTLVRVLESSPDLGPLAAVVAGAKLDKTKIAFVGISLGAIIGTVFAAQESDLKAVVLNVGGAGLATQLANHSPNIMAGGGLYARFAVEYGMTFAAQLKADSPFINTVQHLLDGADPAAFAPHIFRDPMKIGSVTLEAKNILNTFDRWDHYVPNEANESLARALGLPLAKPSLPLHHVTLVEVDVPGGTFTPTGSHTGLTVLQGIAVHGSSFFSKRAEREYAIPFPNYAAADLPAQFPAVKKPFTLPSPIYETHKMISSFLRGAFAGGAPKITDIPTPIEDYDGDGHPDDKDADPNDPTVW